MRTPLLFIVTVAANLLLFWWRTANAAGRNVIIFVADGLRRCSVNAQDAPTLLSVRQKGVDFENSHSQDMGRGFLERLNGWFSGILVDLREQKLVLFNDRYGVNRIYYHEDAHRFYFSSEAKSLLKMLPEDLLPALHQLIFCETCRAEALQLRAD